MLKQMQNTFFKQNVTLPDFGNVTDSVRWMRRKTNTYSLV